MKKTVFIMVVCAALMISLASATDYSKVADAADMTTVETVGVDGMEPVYGTDVVDGTYDVQVESSSSMFQISRAVLRVEDGKMEADLTLSGTGYLVLYMGTGVQAAADEESSYIGYTVGEDGAYTYTVPVEALDAPIPCAAFSKKKEQWYDRSLLFRADSLPAEAVLVELPDYEELERQARDARIQAMRDEDAAETETVSEETPASLPQEDGTYTVSVDLEGGSGRASILSPTAMIIQDGNAVVQLQWSSPHYDYMLVDGVRYEPLNTEGNSLFAVPISALDQPMTVIADTTAMSVPHEIEYTLTFSLEENTFGEVEGTSLVKPLAICGVSVVCMLLLGLAFRRKHG